MVKSHPQISLPTKIKVGSVDITVQQYDNLTKIAGEEGSFDEGQQIIQIDRSIVDKQNSYSVLVMLHELSHCIYNQHLLKDANEEVVVNAFSHGMTQLLKDNPKFNQWMSLCLTS